MISTNSPKSEAMSTGEILILPEVAERLKASVKTVRRRIADGKIRAFKEGGRVCVLATDLADYLEKIIRTAAPR